VLLAGRAAVVFEHFVELKHGGAASCRTPWGTACILLNKLVKGKFFIFLTQLSIYVSKDIWCLQRYPAFFNRAFHINSIGLDLSLKICVDAFRM
jgi:hypothetical protein